MSLLREIQDAAISDATDLATVLRKCRILASRLKHEGLKQWTQHELDGYPSNDALPQYRILKCQSIGTFFGVFGRQLRNAPIPITSVPEEMRVSLSTVYFRSGVASLKHLVENSKGGTLQEKWSAEACGIVGESIFEDMNLMEAHKVIPKNAVVGILDTVRNRILNFAIEIEAENPDAGDSMAAEPLPQAKVQQIFNNYITGSVGNIASGSQHFSQIATVQVEQDNFESLAEFLKTECGVHPDDLDELKIAIKTDGRLKQNRFGGKVAAWFGKVMSKSAQGLLKVGTDVASKVVSEALLRYYGIQK